MAGFADDVSAIARFDAGPGRVVVPDEEHDEVTQADDLASLERESVEPLDPGGVGTVDPGDELPIHERLIAAYGRLWEEVTVVSVLDLVAIEAVYLATMAKVVVDETTQEEYLTAVGLSYSNYVREYAFDYVTLFVSLWEFVLKETQCRTASLEFSAEAVLGMATGEALDFDAMKTSLTAECAPLLVPVLDAFAAIHAWDKTLRNDTRHVVGAALEIFGELWVAAVEKMADAEMLALLDKYKSNHVAIGQLHGTLIGVVIAEVFIDELLTLGLGKAARFTRYIRKATP